jgi:hypothetical protein
MVFWVWSHFRCVLFLLGLIYVINCIRLNITYSARTLSKFTYNSSIDNWKTVKRVRYTFNYGLHYIGYLTVFEEYSDAN